jgi:hypothetical protein
MSESSRLRTAAERAVARMCSLVGKRRLIHVPVAQHAAIPYSLDTVTRSYAEWLEVKHPAHHHAFMKRERAEPEAAQAEAATFSMLRSAQANPEPAEDPSTGGVDFLCTPNGRLPFVVEVTTVLCDTVTENSGLQHIPQAGITSFGQITRKLLDEAVDKARQLANYPDARVLVIATQHSGAHLLMGARGAQELLTGTTAISGRIGDPDADFQMTTHLANSVFFRRTPGGNIEPARRSISAILLMTITGSGSSVIGLLHPEPVHAFDIGSLELVHFARIREWPIRDGRFRLEWVGPDPSPKLYSHWPIELTTRELR